MSTITGQPALSEGSESIADAWKAVRAGSEIQFAPLPEQAPPQPPDWLVRLQEWLSGLLEPLGRFLGLSWPIFKWVLVAFAALLLAVLAWRLLAPLRRWRPRRSTVQETWSPGQQEALALLDDADALAAAGRFDEATHLLLRRSVGQIRAVRPDWLEPSSTAREIAAMPALPDRARGAFAIIAERVERSLFALRPLDAQDWQSARAAYANFALDGLQTDSGR